MYIITALDFNTSYENLGTPFLMHYVCTCGLHFLGTSIIVFPSSKKKKKVQSRPHNLTVSREK